MAAAHLLAGYPPRAPQWGQRHDNTRAREWGTAIQVACELRGERTRAITLGASRASPGCCQRRCQTPLEEMARKAGSPV